VSNYHREPPDDVIPQVMTLKVLVVKNHWLAVWLDCFRVWPEGITFFLRIRKNPRSSNHPDLYGRAAPKGQVIFPGFRLQITYPDGQAVGWQPEEHNRGPAPGNAPHLRSVGSSASDSHFDAELLLSPVPSQGTLAFSFIWPQGLICESRAFENAEPFAAALTGVETLWDSQSK
jgi:hypothetical protein